MSEQAHTTGKPQLHFEVTFDAEKWGWLFDIDDLTAVELTAVGVQPASTGESLCYDVTASRAARGAIFGAVGGMKSQT